MKSCKILDLKNDAQFFKYFSAKNSKTLANQSHTIMDLANKTSLTDPFSTTQ
jgi:hypothetical protein